MALVGDILVHVREQIPDTPSFLLAPTFNFSSSTVGGSIPFGNYYVVLTATNQWGESLPSAEQLIGFASGQTNQFTINILTYAPGTQGFNLYIGLSPGAENGYLSFVGNVNPGTGDQIFKSITGLTPDVPPVRATAALPDSDGNFISAYSLYRYLRMGLVRAGRVSGGIRDQTGVQAINGQSQYRMSQGSWINFTNGWYDGWVLDFPKSTDVFRHNPVPGTAGGIFVQKFAEEIVFELWPQPSRSGVSQNLAGPIGATDTFLILQNATGLLGMGMIMIDSELIVYSTISGNQLGGLTRGVGGTLPAAHAIDAPALEQNIRLEGFRMPTLYVIGNAAVPMAVPFGWDEALENYVLGHIKLAEQDLQGMKQLHNDFDETIKFLATMARGKSKPRQIGDVGRETYPGGFAGGLLIP